MLKKLNGQKAKNLIPFIGVIAVCAVLLIGITAVSAKKILTIQFNGAEGKLSTYKDTVEELLEEINLHLGEKDKINLSLSEKLSDSTILKIKTAVPLTVKTKDKQVQLLSAHDTLKEFFEEEKEELEKNGIEYEENYEVYPHINTMPVENLSVTIIKVEEKTVTENEEIDFETIEEEDENLNSGVTKIKSEGKKGEKINTYKIIEKDGEEISRTLISSQVVKEPENEVVSKGTGSVLTASRGENFKKKITCVATAYCGDGITATGTVPKRNPGGISTIAVDPSFIPLGTKVYIEGYGYAVAEDTGGVIKGNKIDLFLNSYSECMNWGRRNVTLHIVAYPGEW